MLCIKKAKEGWLFFVQKLNEEKRLGFNHPLLTSCFLLLVGMSSSDALLYAKNLAGELHPLCSTTSWEIRQELSELYCPREPHRIRLLEAEDSVVPFVVAERTPFRVSITHSHYGWTLYVGERVRYYYHIIIQIWEIGHLGQRHHFEKRCLYEPSSDQFVSEEIDTWNEEEDADEDGRYDPYPAINDETPHYASLYELLDADTTLPLRIRHAALRAVYRKWSRALPRLIRLVMQRDEIPVRPLSYPMIHHRRLLWEPYFHFRKTYPRYPLYE